MPRRYVRHKIKGSIYSWNEQSADNENLEEISEEEAFPENTKRGKAIKKRKSRVSLDTDPKQLEDAVNPDTTSPGLAVQAGRGLPKKG